MNTSGFTLRAARFVSSLSSVAEEDDPDDETNTDGLDDGGGMDDEADGDLDFEGDEDPPREDV